MCPPLTCYFMEGALDLVVSWVSGHLKIQNFQNSKIIQLLQKMGGHFFISSLVEIEKKFNNNFFFAKTQIIFFTSILSTSGSINPFWSGWYNIIIIIDVIIVIFVVHKSIFLRRTKKSKSNLFSWKNAKIGNRIKFLAKK